MKRIDGKVQCEMCNKFATLGNAKKLGWIWFTGNLPETVHYCPQCQINYDEVIQGKAMEADIKLEI